MAVNLTAYFPKDGTTIPLEKLVLKFNNFLSAKLPKFKNNLINSKQKYAYPITKDWLDSNGFIYDSINIVDSADQKVNFLKKFNVIYL